MAQISSRDFVVRVSPAGEKTCRLEVAPKENTVSGADILPSLNEETERVEMQPGLTGTHGNFLGDRNGELSRCLRVQGNSVAHDVFGSR